MTGYSIMPLPEVVVHYVHRTLTDPIYHLPVQITVASYGDYGPCSNCLNTFSLGERRLLFLYNPFSEQQKADFAGPIFIHAERCQPYSTRHLFPEALRSLPLVLLGYDQQNHFVAEEHPRTLNIEYNIDTLFQHAEVAFLHGRNTETKGFLLRIER